MRSRAVSDNELELTYSVASSPSVITISLVFTPNTRQLAAISVHASRPHSRPHPEDGDDSDENDLDITADMGDVVDVSVQANDVHGVVAAILTRVRDLYTNEGS